MSTTQNDYEAVKKLSTIRTMIEKYKEKKRAKKS